jgi:hypothetical protein
VAVPWRRRDWGWVLTNAGVVILLLGAARSYSGSLSGEVCLRANDRTDHVTLRRCGEITVVQSVAGQPVTRRFEFEPGPMDWRVGQTLELGALSGLSLKVLRYYRHATPQVDWVPDGTDNQGAALRLALSDRNGQILDTQWLAASAYGGETLMGPAQYSFLPLPCATMLEDVLDPPAVQPGTAGVLSIHYAGEMCRVPVAGQTGRTILLPSSGVAVDIVSYYPDAMPAPDGRSFTARSDRPRNPVVELRVHVPGDASPMRQVAFGKAPLLNLDGVYGRACPVRFWYHHPGLPRTPGMEFVQTPEGKLYCRQVTADGVGAACEVVLHRKMPVGGQLFLEVTQHIPCARQEVTFHPVDSSACRTAGRDAAVLVELGVGATRRQVWLSGGEDEFSVREIVAPEGVHVVRFARARRPLGFTLVWPRDPHGAPAGDAGGTPAAPTVHLHDPQQGLETTHDFSVGAACSFGDFSFRSAGVRKLPDGGEAIVLQATADPGRWLTMLGMGVICLGAIDMFRQRAHLFRHLPETVQRPTDSDVPVDGRLAA